MKQEVDRDEQKVRDTKRQSNALTETCFDRYRPVLDQKESVESPGVVDGGGWRDRERAAWKWVLNAVIMTGARELIIEVVWRDCG